MPTSQLSGEEHRYIVEENIVVTLLVKERFK